MKKEMLINVLQPEECRIAVLEDVLGGSPGGLTNSLTFGGNAS